MEVFLKKIGVCPRMLLIAAAALLSIIVLNDNAFSMASASILFESPVPVPFLSAPYYGQVQVNCVFDHEYPDFDVDRISWPYVRHYNGQIANTEQITYLNYSAHTGIDYNVRYGLVRSAAPGHVEDAGWANPANHLEGYGLHVKLSHSARMTPTQEITTYWTIYGHLSELHVSADTDVGSDEEVDRIIGVSGRTGKSDGPHLHFELQNSALDPTDPYGWIGYAGVDPWERDYGTRSFDLWEAYPSNTGIWNIESVPGFNEVFTYPTGAEIPPPVPVSPPSSGSLVDDESPEGFLYSVLNHGESFWEPTSCNDQVGARCMASDSASRSARWSFSGTPNALYDVYVNIPSAPDPAADYCDTVTYSISTALRLL